jgi:hypothetical protein
MGGCGCDHGADDNGDEKNDINGGAGVVDDDGAAADDDDGVSDADSDGGDYESDFTDLDDDDGDGGDDDDVDMIMNFATRTIFTVDECRGRVTLLTLNRQPLDLELSL